MRMRWRSARITRALASVLRFARRSAFPTYCARRDEGAFRNAIGDVRERNVRATVTRTVVRASIWSGQPSLQPGSQETMATAALAAAKLKRRSNADMNRLRQPPPPPVSGDATIRLKLLTIGAAHSGKSCIVKRYCEGRFVSKYVQTVGVDYGVKPVDVDGTIAREFLGFVWTFCLPRGAQRVLQGHVLMLVGLRRVGPQFLRGARNVAPGSF